MKSLLFFNSLLLLSTLVCSGAYAAPVKINSVSDLDFGTAGAGDPPKTISAGTSETSANASFSVTGDANRAYTISLPASASMTIGNGPTADSIPITNFTSFPAPGPNGLLNAAGTQNLFVGATRAAIRIDQRAGAYTGSYSITVVY